MFGRWTDAVLGGRGLYLDATSILWFNVRNGILVLRVCINGSFSDTERCYRQGGAVIVVPAATAPMWGTGDFSLRVQATSEVFRDLRPTTDITVNVHVRER